MAYKRDLSKPLAPTFGDDKPKRKVKKKPRVGSRKDVKQKAAKIYTKEIASKAKDAKTRKEYRYKDVPESQSKDNTTGVYKGRYGGSSPNRLKSGYKSSGARLADNRAIVTDAKFKKKAVKSKAKEAIKKEKRNISVNKTPKTLKDLKANKKKAIANVKAEKKAAKRYIKSESQRDASISKVKGMKTNVSKKKKDIKSEVKKLKKASKKDIKSAKKDFKKDIGSYVKYERQEQAKSKHKSYKGKLKTYKKKAIARTKNK